MFEDVEDEFELDMINNRDSDDEEEKKSATRRRLSKKMNFSQVSFFFLFGNCYKSSKNLNDYFPFLLKPKLYLKHGAVGENERRHRKRKN